MWSLWRGSIYKTLEAAAAKKTQLNRIDLALTLCDDDCDRTTSLSCIFGVKSKRLVKKEGPLSSSYFKKRRRGGKRKKKVKERATTTAIIRWEAAAGTTLLVVSHSVHQREYKSMRN